VGSIREVSSFRHALLTGFFQEGKGNLKECGRKVWTGFIWLRIESSCGAVLITVMNLRLPQKAWVFLDKLRNY
jgi:hypothetical protein